MSSHHNVSRGLVTRRAPNRRALATFRTVVSSYRNVSRGRVTCRVHFAKARGEAAPLQPEPPGAVIRGGEGGEDWLEQSAGEALVRQHRHPGSEKEGAIEHERAHRVFSPGRVLNIHLVTGHAGRDVCVR
eukprot:CAMPEP_0180303138 /NCGR_PEP_ID=MMETSP0988-20121125/24798_1 /TAXON_ID=697907 /ORGANISM="non described non described, Strain CCMP2293" /LENGTH=129 /DNA_ID=CAMNT_0022284615 /DNA_START=127 /DNA_END=513 /DNA_ORIENTATION=-